MRNILVLGAGLVARPAVHYLLNQPGLSVSLADQDIERARAIIGQNEGGTALQADVRDTEALSRLVAAADIVVSLLPWTLHPLIARLCLEHKKHLVTASYVKEEMRSLDAAARDRGLLFLNEVGVDPGLDHMAAMQVIDGVHDKGGQVVAFYSYCGGLPALNNNNNPLGYKFSWSPEGAVLSAINDGRYLEDGRIIEIPSAQLFEHYWLKNVPGAGVFEAYVNRDALPYRERYGIESVRSIYRGTLRNIGYCETWDYFKKLGLLNRQMKFDFNEVSPRQMMANIINTDREDVPEAVADYLHIPPHSLTIKKLQWLGLFSDYRLPLGLASVFEMFAYLLKKKLVYARGESDLLVQHHEFEAAYPGGGMERIQSTLIHVGDPDGDTAMSRTVGLPVAIATRLIAEGNLDLKGVHIPVSRQLYEPVLAELAERGIRFVERRTEIIPKTEEKPYYYENTADPG